MIVVENIVIDGNNYTHTYSDSGYYIRKISTGEIYSDAIDPVDSGRVYEETEDIIPVNETKERD